MKAPKEEAIIKNMAQDATIPGTASEEENVKIEGSFTWLGKKWAKYCPARVCKFLFCTRCISP